MNTEETIAAGAQPPWEATFPHPEYGDLTFKATKLPLTGDFLQAAVLQEQIAPGVTRGMNALIAEACAGILTFFIRPVISEKRIEDPDNPGHEKLKQTFYDPMVDEHWEFATIVWTTWTAWRDELLSERTMEKVKNSSGATAEPETVAPSPAITD